MGAKRRSVGADSVAEVVGEFRIPLPEVSGLALRRTRAGSYRLLAVGDASTELAATTLDAAGDPGEWELLDLATLSGVPHLEQLEAVASDGDRFVAVMGEEPSRVTVGDAATRRLVATWALDPSPIPSLAKAWAKDANSRGEGLTLLRSGHLLVAKEKRPAGLVEFGPASDAPLGVTAASLLPEGEDFEPAGGDTLVALAWWPYEGDVLSDLSDLAADPGGGVWLLSDRSRAMGRLGGDLAPGDSGFRLVHRVRLPATVDKPEGLAFLPEGDAYVASDLPARGAVNLVRLRLPGEVRPGAGPAAV